MHIGISRKGGRVKVSASALEEACQDLIREKPPDCWLFRSLPAACAIRVLVRSKQQTERLEAHKASQCAEITARDKKKKELLVCIEQGIACGQMNCRGC